MLKNTSNTTVRLMWGGKETVLAPGQTCTFTERLLEQRMTLKHPELSIITDPTPELQKAAAEPEAPKAKPKARAKKA